MFMLECEGQTANTRNQLKVNEKKKDTMCSVGKYKIVLFLFVWLKG